MRKVVGSVPSNPCIRSAVTSYREFLSEMRGAALSHLREVAGDERLVPEVAEEVFGLFGVSAPEQYLAQLKDHLARSIDARAATVVGLLTMPQSLALHRCVSRYYNSARYPEPGNEVPSEERESVPLLLDALRTEVDLAGSSVSFLAGLLEVLQAPPRQAPAGSVAG